MKTWMGVVLALPVAVVTWLVVGSIPNMLGNYGCLAAGFVLGVGPVSGVLAAGWVIKVFAAQEAADEAERRRKEMADEAERRRKESEIAARQAEESRLRSEILRLNEESLGAFEQIPIQFRLAEEHLDKAERDFAKGAFVPFWESVEKTAVALGGVEERVRLIERHSTAYREAIKKGKTFGIKAPAFAISSQSAPKLMITSEASKRMSEIVDRAQCNFQFSQTYLQIKTNQILVAGFMTLAHALDEMTWRITQSVDDLSSAVTGVAETLDQSLQAVHKQGERIANATGGLLAEATASSAREQKALEMLDNIQRKRYPSVIHGGLR